MFWAEGANCPRCHAHPPLNIVRFVPSGTATPLIRLRSTYAGRVDSSMGKDVSQASFSREERARYRRKVRRCLDVFALMLHDFRCDADRPPTGLEIELNLIDDDAQPAMRNAEIIADLSDPSFQTELGQFSLEIKVG